MAVKTVIPNEKGKIYLLCPFCENNCFESADKYPFHKIINRKCSCGNSWEFIIEQRKAFRKRTSLSAIWWKMVTPITYQSSTISDLTLDGGCMVASENHNLQIGEHIRLLFKLDNEKRTKIEREAVVRWINKNEIGCKFVGKYVYDPELGFYVQDFKIPK